MSQMTQTLPSPLPSRVVYDSLLVENPVYDPIGLFYQARVYGVCRGNVMPLILSTPVAVRRIEEVTITDAEIDAVIEQRPELVNNRMAAAMIRSFTRLYALAAETEPAPVIPDPEVTPDAP